MKLGIVLPSGGTRGIITTKLLTEINNRVEKLAIAKGKAFSGIASEADYLAGTSIGSLITGAMASGHTPESITKIFHDNAGQILKKSSFVPLTKPCYSSVNLERILNEKIGEKTIGTVDKKILITSYNLEKSEQTTFTNLGNEDIRHKMNGYAWSVDNIKLKDAVQASSAVPGVFQSKEIEYARDSSGVKKYHEVDGAMQNISPVMDLVLAMNKLEKVNFKDMFILSVGTGTLNKDAIAHVKDQGVVGHILSVQDITVGHLCAVQDTSENQVQLLVEGNGGKFFRLEPQVSVNEFCSALDDSKKQIDRYEEIADDYISMNNDYLNEIAEQIVDYCL